MSKWCLRVGAGETTVIIAWEDVLEKRVYRTSRPRAVPFLL